MGKPTIRQKSFIYKNNVEWIGEKRGVLTAEGKPELRVATPPEFRGHPGIWSPEDLFVASVNTCIMTTFLYYIEKEDILIKSYKSSAEGILEMSGKGLSFTRIEVRPFLSIAEKTDKEKIKKVFEIAEQHCLISNSIKAEVKVIPEIIIK